MLTAEVVRLRARNVTSAAVLIFLQRKLLVLAMLVVRKGSTVLKIWIQPSGAKVPRSRFVYVADKVATYKAAITKNGGAFCVSNQGLNGVESWLLKRPLPVD